MILGYVRNSEPLHIKSLSYSKIVETLKDLETIFTYKWSEGFIRFSSCDSDKLPLVFYCDGNRKMYILEDVHFIIDVTVHNEYVIDYYKEKIVFREITFPEVVFLY